MSDLHLNYSTSVSPVKSSQLPLPGFEPVAHHNQGSTPRKPYLVIRRGGPWRSYGVPSRLRGLTVGVLRQKEEQVREYLGGGGGLTHGESQIVMELLRLWTRYGQVYCKSDQMRQNGILPFVAADGHEFTGTPATQCAPGCSQRTFWRAIAALRERNLVIVVNRFLIRPHAQISNLYKLNRLILLIVRYLAEHGVAIPQAFRERYPVVEFASFWRWCRADGCDGCGLSSAHPRTS